MTTLSERSSAVTQLEFHQAMNDFKTMFPEMDEDVIEVVLRANNGAVDATIDQLLAMNQDSENERLRAELDASDNNEVPPRYSPATPPPSYQQAVPNSLKHSKIGGILEKASGDSSNSSHITIEAAVNKCETNASLSTDSLRYKHKWLPPLLGELPSTFLRIQPNENQMKLASNVTRLRPESVSSISSAMLQQKMEENQRQRQLSFSSDDPELTQFLEDERVAIFLQNEEFVRELRRNKDFMSSLELDTARDAHHSVAHESPSAVASSHMESDAAFKETLKHMGKVSRRKFAQLARLFSRRKRRSFQQIVGETGGNNSRDNLLVRGEDEYTKLQNEGSDYEDERENLLETRDENHSHLSINDLNKTKTIT